MDNDFATGYALGSDSGNNSGNGMWGGDGWWAIILFAMIFGWGRGGFGFGGFGGGASTDPGLQGIATRADVNEAIAFNGLERGISAIQQGVCDATYALTNTMNNGFSQAALGRCQDNAALMAQLNQMSYQMQDCCCQTQGAIKDVRYDMAAQACDTRNTIQNTTRDIIDNQNANYRGLMDFMVQSKIDSLQSENQALKLAASQANQNSYLTATLDAQTNELIRRINPMPVPAYQVPAPYPFCGSGYGCGC